MEIFLALYPKENHFIFLLFILNKGEEYHIFARVVLSDTNEESSSRNTNYRDGV